MTYGVSKTKSTSGHDSRPFALQQNNIDKHITNRLHYFKNLQKQLDAHATKASSIEKEKQKEVNYQSEFDRVRREITQSVFHGGVSTTSLKNRQKELEALGAVAVSGIN